jgi:hypothetical protein
MKYHEVLSNQGVVITDKSGSWAVFESVEKAQKAHWLLKSTQPLRELPARVFNLASIRVYAFKVPTD